MDVSNASGYDGCTVAADACFVAKHTSDRTKVVLAETLEPAGPAGRQDVRARLRPRGRRGSASRRHDRSRRVGRRVRGRRGGDLPAAELLRVPRARAGARRRRGRRRRARRSRTSTSCRSACSRRPGAYGCAMAIGEGQSVGCPPLYGGPHYGFFAARQEFVRRMPGRIVGETVDLDGRARVRSHAPDPRAAHPPREGDVEHHDEPDAARARRARDADVARPAGAARGRRDVRRARRVREGAGRPPARVRAADVQRGRVPASACRRETSSATHATRGVHPGYALGRDYPGMDDVLLVALTEKRTPADVDRLAAVLAEVC